MSGNGFEELYLFQGLTPAQVEALSLIFIPCFYAADTVIFEQDALAENLYIVVKGEVVVRFKPDDGAAITVARIYPGGVVGWSAAIGSRCYTSAAITIIDTHLLRVSNIALRQLCQEDQETSQIILDRLATAIVKRLRNTHPQVVAMLNMGLRSAINASEVKI